MLHILPGALFLIVLLVVLVFRPILRDRLLIRNYFFPTVILAAVLMPMMVYGILVYIGAGNGSLWVAEGSKDGYQPSLAWSVYYQFVDPGNQQMAASNYVAWTTTLAILGTIILNGLLVSSLINIVDRRKERWLKGEIRYSSCHINHHTIVIGGSDISVGIIRSIIEKRRNRGPIVVLAKCDIEDLRRRILSAVGDRGNVVLCYGDRTSQDDIRSVHPHLADEVFVIGEEVNQQNDDESYHDTLNMRCLHLLGKAAEHRPAKRGELTCHVMFEYQTTFAALQIVDIDEAKIAFRPFNYYESCALNVFSGDYPTKEHPAKYMPLDGEGITEQDTCFVHLVVVGMSRMGIAMANIAAHLAHYPNFEREGSSEKIRTRISFVDINVEQEAQYYMGRFEELFKLARYRFYDPDNAAASKPWQCDMAKYYPEEHLGEDFIDVEWEFVGGAIDSEGVRRYLVDVARNKRAKLTIAICLPESNRAVASAIYMPDEVFSSSSTQQVLVYQRKGGEIIDQISASNYHYHGKLRPFGMDDSCYNLERIDEITAINKRIDSEYKTAKNEYRKCKPQTVANKAKSNAANLWSNYYNIYSARSKFRACTPDIVISHGLASDYEFKDHFEMMLGRMEHNRWNVEQLLMRYRPLTKEEQDGAKMVSAEGDDAEKNRLKSQGAHLDICSNSMLDRIDVGISQMDRALVDVLPGAYRGLYGTLKTKE